MGVLLVVGLAAVAVVSGQASAAGGGLSRREVSRNPAGKLVLFAQKRKAGVAVGQGVTQGRTEADSRVVLLADEAVENAATEGMNTGTDRIWAKSGLYVRGRGAWSVPGVEGRWILTPYPADLRGRRPGIAGLASALAQEPETFGPVVDALSADGQGKVPGGRGTTGQRWVTDLGWDAALALSSWTAPPLRADFTDLDGRLHARWGQPVGPDARGGQEIEVKPAAKAKIDSRLEVWTSSDGLVGLRLSVDPRRLDRALEPFSLTVAVRNTGSSRRITVPSGTDVLTGEQAAAIRSELLALEPGLAPVTP